MSPGRRFLGLTLVAAALAPRPLGAQAELPADVRLHGPRDFGWRVGDVLELEAVVRVPGEVVLDGTSLARPLPAWLEVRESGWTRRDSAGWGLYELRFRYQTFHVPAGVERVEIPALPLAFRSADGRREVAGAVPGFGFTISPLTDSASAASGWWRPPAPREGAVHLSGGVLVMLVGLWGAAALGARRRRRASPLWRARQEVARADDCRSALLALHRALESKVASAAFGHELERLLARWPEAEEERDAIEEFFALSRQYFFARDGGPPAGARDPECLRRVNRLAERLARLEARGG